MRVRSGLWPAAIAVALFAATPAPALDWNTALAAAAEARPAPAQAHRCPRGYAPTRRGDCMRIRHVQRVTDLDRHWRRYAPGVRYDPPPPRGKRVPRFIFSFGPSQ